jgi:hypothetical protein
MWSDLATTLTGTRVALEPFAARHEAGLRAAAADERISAWLPAKLHEPAGFDAWFAHAMQMSAAKLDAPFATVSRVIDREWPDVRANLERRLALSRLSS